MTVSAISRRSLLTSSIALLIPIAMQGTVLEALAQATATPPALSPEQLDSYLAIGTDGSVTVFFGKIDCGQGLDVGVRQIVAEELDVSVSRVKVVMGDTARTLNQGGASDASGISQGAAPLRNAAAEARRILIEKAAAQFRVDPGTLAVENGIIFSREQPTLRTSYQSLFGGKPLDTPVNWNKKFGNDLLVTGKAEPKKPSDYKLVGTTVKRDDIAEKVFARLDYVTDIRVPGMAHARMIRPPFAGAEPIGVDETSIAGIPGTRIVWKKGFLAVVAEKEWDAIKASTALNVKWSDPPNAFPDQKNLHDYIRRTPPAKRKVEMDVGTVDMTLAKAAKVLHAEYEWPFHSHSSMGPACAIADVKADRATVWTGSQKPHAVRDGIASLLGLPPERVHSIWAVGPGSYGRNDAGDAVFDAAILSREIGRPVRVQYMRHEGHAWDPKSPASVHTVTGGIDEKGDVVALRFEAKSFSRLNVFHSETDPRDSLAGMSMGLPLNPQDAYLFAGESYPGDAYSFPNKRMAWETIPPLLDRSSPLRTSHLRAPLGLDLTFASESFIDELAFAARTDAVAFRLQYLISERDRAVVQAAAERSDWDTRISGPRHNGDGNIVSGRGICYGRRDKTLVALVAHIDVIRSTGQVRVKRFTVAHDCGLIINPGGLKQCIETQLVYALSRTLFEEVQFNRSTVTSVDWLTYPILEAASAPEQVEVVLINRPEIAPSGAGEPSVSTVGAAIGNAIFDATGIRIRKGPLSPEQLKTALAG
jgi:nicotinate dehydrogenase subunit B